MDPERPIGVFDSGVGGLAVLRAIRERLPLEPMVYLGDTARVPYGTKSHRSVRRYALQAGSHLVDRGIKLLVVACNTVSAVALDDLARAFDPLPIVGVIEPAVDAALHNRQGGSYLVLGTEGTVERGAYGEAIRRRAPGAHVEEVACSLFVALVEDGWTRGPIVDAIVDSYLAPLAERWPDGRPDSVILGCTHFGLLEEALRRRLEGLPLVDSAITVASAVNDEINRRGLASSKEAGDVTFLATDHPERFARVGQAFLGTALAPEAIQWIDL